MKKSENPRHDCPALGKNAIICRVFNSAYPDKIYYKCPFCSFTVEELDHHKKEVKNEH